MPKPEIHCWECHQDVSRVFAHFWLGKYICAECWNELLSQARDNEKQMHVHPEVDLAF